MADARSPEEIAESTERLRLIRYIVIAVASVLSILAMTLPLMAVGQMVADLAGKDTDVNVSVALQLGLVVTFSLGGGFVAYKLIRQKQELEKLRADRTTLERQLLECKRSLRRGGGSGVRV